VTPAPGQAVSGRCHRAGVALKRALRRMARAVPRQVLKVTAPFGDRAYLAADVPAPDLTRHTKLRARVVEAGNRPGFRVLEIGSREVTGRYGLRERLGQATYVGFDYYPGPNVDVAGDAHRLSSYFDEPFDVIYCTAVFEHFAMPWVVAEEIATLLKIGGMLFVETHFSFSSHERPWNFFQFSDMGLRVLFSEQLGIECIEASMQNPIVGRFSHFAEAYLRYQPVRGLYCHSSFMGRKVRQVEGFDWRTVDLNALVSGTAYPKPRDGKAAATGCEDAVAGGPLIG
jgi:hypothetical protein